VNAALAEPANNSSGLRIRITTGLILLAGFLVALYRLPQPAWTGLVILIIALAGWEWSGFNSSSSPIRILYSLLTVVLALASLRVDALFVYVVSALFWAAVVPVWLKKQWKPGLMLFWITGWLVLPPAALALIELRALGPHVLLAVLTVVWLVDSTAYFTGRAFGKRKLAPTVSPGKTWEGVAGALAAVSIYGMTLSAFALPDCGTACLVRLLPALWLLLALSILGDLFESLQKRQAGIKDSGDILPGHGGILDRIDAQLAALPAAALLLTFWRT
jgi:phosphatidate cytidylyltransferase